MFFALCLFLISQAHVDNHGHDHDVDAAVKEVIGECTAVIQNVGVFVDKIQNVDTRRRAAEKAAELAKHVERNLSTCGALLETVKNWRYQILPMEQRRELGKVGKIVLTESERDYVNTLLKPVYKKIGKVLYAASEDGDAGSRFHGLCDDQGPTVVIVNTTTGDVFGGYTDVPWGLTGVYMESSTSFLFQLRPTRKQYKINQYNRAVYHTKKDGPQFGTSDLFISDKALSNSKSYSKGGSSYIFPKYPSYELANYRFHFQVEDYVVAEASYLKFM
jgi:hypothetical protein